MQNKQHISGSFSSLNIICGSSKNSSFVIHELIMQHFYVFQKINLQNFSVTWNRINNSSELLNNISVNYLDLDQAYATHEFQVQSKFLYQNSHIQNSREFKDETRYLNGITTEQLFIISIARDYPQSPFILLLKIENQTHSFYFFLFLRSHLTIIYKYKDNNIFFAFSLLCIFL